MPPSSTDHTDSRKTPPKTRLSRLVQPRNGLFWLLLAVNLLSLLLGWLVRAHPMPPVLAVLVTVFALGNAGLGAALAWRLMRS